MKTYLKPELSILAIATEQALSAFNRFTQFESIDGNVKNSITSYFGNSGVTI